MITPEGVVIEAILDQKDPCDYCKTNAPAAPEGQPSTAPPPAIALFKWTESGQPYRLVLCMTCSREKRAELRRRPIANLQPLVLATTSPSAGAAAPPSPSSPLAPMVSAGPWAGAPLSSAAAPLSSKNLTPPIGVLPPGLRPTRITLARVEKKPTGPAPLELLPAVARGATLDPVLASVGEVEVLDGGDDVAVAGRSIAVRAEGGAATADVGAHVDPAASADATRHPALTFLARLARGSRPTMKDSLDTIAQIVSGPDANLANFPWHGLRYNHTALIRSALVERYAPTTANKMLSALRCVLHEAWKLGLIDTDSYQRAAEIEDVKGSRIPVGIALSRAQMDTLFRACARDETPSGRRDAALLALLFGTGIRRAEAVSVVLADYDPQDGHFVVRRGKGNKDRPAWLAEQGRQAIAEWLSVRGRKAGPILCPLDAYGRPRPGKGMSTESVYVRLRRLAAIAGVPRFAPHDTRRTYITRALEDGEDLVTVQRLVGHERVETTARYDRRGEVALREAAHRRTIPFHSAIPEAVTESPSTEATKAPPSIEPMAAPSEAAAIAPLAELQREEATTTEAIAEAMPSAPIEKATSSSTPKKRPAAQKKAPTIAAGASSRARTTPRPRRSSTKRPAKSRPKPGKTQRLRGGRKRSARGKAKR